MKKALLLFFVVAGATTMLARPNEDRPTTTDAPTTVTETTDQTMKLTLKQLTLATIAALEAKGDLSRLAVELDKGLANGMTVSELKEALAHLYAYTGFPRSLNALGTLQSVVKERTRKHLPVEEGKEASPLPDDFDALREGTKVQTQLTGAPFTFDFAPQTDYYLKAHLFGDIFARDNLTFKERELVTIGALAAMEGVEPQLKSHIRGSKNMGLTEAELRDLPQVLLRNVGETEAWRMRRALAETHGDSTVEGRPVDFAVWPKGEPNTAYARYFSGESFLAPLDADKGGPVNVTFEPGCRNNWHIHHGGVQVLICVVGRGWYQEWGKEPVEMRAGTVIAIPAEVKHWHGAARDAWFQHLTYMTRTTGDATSEWLEAVADEAYDRLP